MASPDYQKLNLEEYAGTLLLDFDIGLQMI